VPFAASPFHFRRVLASFIEATRRSVEALSHFVSIDFAFLRPPILPRPRIELVAVDSVIAKKAEQQIESCEHSHPVNAEIPFDWILAEVTGRRGPFEFVLSELSRCPNCTH
jgi:hypothetical protein